MQLQSLFNIGTGSFLFHFPGLWIRIRIHFPS